MFNADMRLYAFYLLEAANAYGQPVKSSEPKGNIKMSVYTTNQNVQDNVNYKAASYMGLTQAPVTDKYIIQYGEKQLKVLYVQPQGRFKQVFMREL